MRRNSSLYVHPSPRDIWCRPVRRRAPHGTCLQLTRFPDVLRAFDSKRYWTLKELSKRVTQTEVWNCLCTCRVLLVLA